MIQQAIILAGGLGTRLREAVPDLPKCMAPVAGRPFLYHVINYLRQQGITSFIFSLGEGYAADRCRDMMIARGVKAGIVNGSGDMATWGTQPNGKPWNIGITDPRDRDKLFAVIPLHESAVTTSGSYEKYVVFNGKRYSHIINPATGYPVTGLTSVTVFGPSAEMANGFSTSLMVLGQKAGLQLLRKYPAYHCIMITDAGKVVRSKGKGG